MIKAACDPVEKKKPERNYGIDALRLVSMLMVIVLHIIGYGGVSDAAGGMKHSLASLMEVFVACAVDIYAIISGYVGYREEDRKQKSSKYITLWTQVFFYSAGICLFAWCVFPGKVETQEVIRSFFPVITARYWYFSSYTIVFFLAPWINRLIHAIDSTQLTRLVWLLIGLFSVLSFAAAGFEKDPFSLNEGYSAIWLLTLYVVGACIKRNKVLHMLSKTKLFLMLVGIYVFVCGLKFVIPDLYGITLYTAPTVFAMAALFVILFSKLRFPAFLNKLILFLAPAAFGVYLIHVHPFVFHKILKDAFSWIADLSFVAVPLVILGCALLIMVGCLVVEKIRLLLFKVTGLDRFITFVGEKIDRLTDKIFDFDKSSKVPKKS